MKAIIWGAAKDLAGSKKFQAAILSGLVWGIGLGLGKLGIVADVDKEDLVPFVGPLWLYIFGQGMADFGKAAASLKAGE
jgi:hypothetical protein